MKKALRRFSFLKKSRFYPTTEKEGEIQADDEEYNNNGYRSSERIPEQLDNKKSSGDSTPPSSNEVLYKDFFFETDEITHAIQQVYDFFPSFDI